MTEERRDAIRERMKARGMTDEQIEERLAGMAGGGPPSGQRGGPPPRDAAAAEAPPAAEDEGGRSFDDLPPETRQEIRDRLRTMGMTEEQIEERVRRGWGPDSRAADAMTPEQIEALRERLRRQGLPRPRSRNASPAAARGGSGRSPSRTWRRPQCASLTSRSGGRSP